MAEKFPILNRYKDSWASDDFIRAALKYLKSRAKLDALRLKAAQGEALMSMQNGRPGASSSTTAQT